MRPQIAIFGGSFNPPGLHHRQMAEALSREFDSVLVVPCGPRPDKQTVNDVDPVHRATLADIAFRGLDRVKVELFDLEQAVFSRTDELQDRYKNLGDLWHVVGSDLTQGGESSVICRHWERGLEIWAALKFLIIARDGYSAKEGELPPQYRLISLETPSAASSMIRERIFKREPFAHMVTPDIAAYIERYGLYRGRIPSRETRFALQTPRLLLFGDERSPRAVEVMKSLEPAVDYENPNCVVVVGGDGTMLRAIRKHWRQRLPFFGINTGHLGFLLNRAPDQSAGTFEPGEMTLYQLPMLYVEMDGADGVTTRDALAFNDAWIERDTSQSAWIEVHVNGRLRIKKLVADGLLVSTAAGSTAYARSMGASPLLVDTPGWLLVGSNVMNPPGWKSALLAMEATAEFIVQNGAKRPVKAFVGGEDFGEVSRMRVRMSRIAAVELAFGAQHDIAEKIASIQFPASPVID